MLRLFFYLAVLVAVLWGHAILASRASLPLLASAYMRGELNIPENLVNALSFVGVALIALLQFPLNPSYDNLAIYFASLVIYIFVGQFLRKEHTRRKWCFCMLLVFLSNCFGNERTFIGKHQGLSGGRHSAGRPADVLSGTGQRIA